MHPPRQVPGIAHQRQSFAPDTLGRIQSPLAGGQQQSPEVAIAQQVQELAITIYCELVAKRHAGSPADPIALRLLAQDAQIAAKAYFESMGVQFDGGS